MKQFPPRHNNSHQLPAVARQLADLQKALAGLGAEITAMATMRVAPEPSEPVMKQHRVLDEHALAVERGLRDPLRILRDKEVARLLSIHWTTIWRWSRTGKMPKPVKVGKHVTGWRASEIAAWIAAKATE